MKTITIERTYFSGGVLGRIPELGIWTLERPWLDNIPFKSCVREGYYEVAPDEEGKYTGKPELQNVIDRTEIVFHVANRVDELQGCIAPGLKAHFDQHETPSVGYSTQALDRVMDLGDHFRLIIKRKL